MDFKNSCQTTPALSQNSSQTTPGGMLDSVSAVGHNVAAKVTEAAASAFATATQPTMGQKLDSNVQAVGNDVNTLRTNVASAISPPPQTLASKVSAAFSPSTSK